MRRSGLVAATVGLRGVDVVLCEGRGHHAEDKVETYGAQGCETAHVAKPQLAGLREASATPSEE